MGNVSIAQSRSAPLPHIALLTRLHFLIAPSSHLSSLSSHPPPPPPSFFLFNHPPSTSFYPPSVLRSPPASMIMARILAYLASFNRSVAIRSPAAQIDHEGTPVSSEF